MKQITHQWTGGLRAIAILAMIPIVIGACDRSSDGDEGKPLILKAHQVANVNPLPDCHGEIRHIFLHAPEHLIDVLSGPAVELLHHLSPNTRVSILCDSEKASKRIDALLAEKGLGNRTGIALIQVPGPLSIWARDRYISVRATVGDIPSLWLFPRLSPHLQEECRTNEHALLSSLQSSYPIVTGISPLVLEGGNLVSTEKHIFVGANVLLDNAHKISLSETTAELSRLFALPVILVGDEKRLAPFPHVDMYLTPITNDHLLVASPWLGHKILGTADEVSREAAKEQLFGQPDASDDRARRFSQVARRLEARGFTITRLPYLDNRGGDFAVTYNNVLQETRSGQHIIYMPVYGIPALDAVAQQTYEALGCTVKTVDVSPVSRLLGAIRCLANVVERSAGSVASPSEKPRTVK